MIYYKSVRLINGKPRLVISDENYNIIKNPTKEQIKIAIDEQYRPKICCVCDKKESFHNWYNHRCDKYNCTGHICTICYQKYDPKSSTNLRKLDADSRIGNLDPSSSRGKGFIGQQIVAKTYNVEDCNLKMDDFNFYVDLSKISEYGYGEVKIATLNCRIYIWNFNGINPYNFNTLFLLCMDKNWPWKDVERVYAIPSDIITTNTSITIYKNPSRNTWHENYEIDSKPFNDTYHKMELKNCNILRKN